MSHNHSLGFDPAHKRTIKQQDAEIYRLNDVLLSHSKQLKSLTSHFKLLDNKYTQLDDQHTDLYEQYTNLDDEHNVLHDQYSDLSDKYTILDQEHIDINLKYSDLSDKYTDLSDKYSKQLKLNKSYQRQLQHLTDKVSLIEEHTNSNHQSITSVDQHSTLQSLMQQIDVKLTNTIIRINGQDSKLTNLIDRINGQDHKLSDTIKRLDHDNNHNTIIVPTLLKPNNTSYKPLINKITNIYKQFIDLYFNITNDPDDLISTLQLFTMFNDWALHNNHPTDKSHSSFSKKFKTALGKDPINVGANCTSHYPYLTKKIPIPP